MRKKDIRFNKKSVFNIFIFMNHIRFVRKIIYVYQPILLTLRILPFCILYFCFI